MIAAAAQHELAILGRTADEVAGAIRGSGLVGTPCSPADCPLARLLESLFPGEEWRVYGWLHNAVFFGPEEARQSFALPVACRAFERAFDRRRYPDLIQPPRRTR